MTGWKRILLLFAILAFVIIAIIGWSLSKPAITVAPAPPPRTALNEAGVTDLPPGASCPSTPICELPSAQAPPPAPKADPVMRERKRFDRNDRNDDGIVNQTEYLHSRQGSFKRMDANGDGLINFSEYSVKQRERFVRSDCDRTGTLNPDEFQSTATRRDAPDPDC